MATDTPLRKGIGAARWVGRFRHLGPSGAVIGLGCFVILLMAALTTGAAIRRHHVELVDAARELHTLDILLSEETGRSLQSVRLVLDNVAEQVAAEGIRTPDAFVEHQSTRAVHDVLLARVAGLPQLDAVTVVDAKGKLVNFSRAWPVPDIDLSDRDYFQHVRGMATDEIYLTEPLVSRGSGTSTVYLARRVTAPDGTFLGLILGAIELTYFDRFYASLHLGPGNIIALWRTDGILLARYPLLAVGQRMPPADITSSDPSFRDVPNVFEKTWSMHGDAPEVRLVASETVDGFPVQINLARSKELILADWLREVVAVGAAVGIAILCLAALIWALLRRFHAYEAVAAASKERERALEARDTAEDALRQAQKMEAVGQLTGGVAHDFNNLLTVVRSSVDLLRRPNLTEERRTRYVDAISDATDRAAKLTGQLLAFARRQALKPEVFDAAENVATVAQLVARLTGSRVTLDTVLPGTPCLVEADPNQFDTAIVNMAVNARDAMGEGGRLTLLVEEADTIPPLRSHPAVAGAFVAVSVRDTGHGIPPDLAARVFEPFFTTKKVGEGTGLGLSQVLGFAKQSGGDVAVASEPGQGTTFTLYLPRAAVGRTRPAAAGRTGPAAEGEGRRVLVVEDMAQVGRIAVQMLTELGYVPVLAESGEAALRELAAAGPDRFDLVFSDVVMPGMSGLDLGRAIRRTYPETPVLLTSGYSQTLTERGSDGFPVLEKPYAIDALACALRDAARSPALARQAG